MQEMSQLLWVPLRATTQWSNAGSVLPPCPPPAALLPSYRLPVCFLSLEGLLRDPAMLWKPCVCQTLCDLYTEEPSEEQHFCVKQTCEFDWETFKDFFFLTSNQHDVFLHYQMEDAQMKKSSTLKRNTVNQLLPQGKTLKCWAFCKNSRVLLWILKEHRAILVSFCCRSKQ